MTRGHTSQVKTINVYLSHAWYQTGLHCLIHMGKCFIHRSMYTKTGVHVLGRLTQINTPDVLGVVLASHALPAGALVEDHPMGTFADVFPRYVNGDNASTLVLQPFVDGASRNLIILETE